ncbi:MAG: RloB family protein [bacterium]
MTKNNTDNFKAKAKKQKPLSLRKHIYLFCEGEVSEKLYFEVFSTFVKSLNIEIVEKGAECTFLKKKAIEYYKKNIERNKLIVNNYEIWLIFDKDDNPHANFDNVIKFCNNGDNKYNMNAAWSNPCFELWLYLHFKFNDCANERIYYSNNLSVEFSKLLNTPYVYEKGDTNVFNLLVKEKRYLYAFNNIKKLCKNHKQSITQNKFHKCDPYTNVHKLVELLDGNR